MIFPSGSCGCSVMTAAQEVRVVPWDPAPADSAAVALAGADSPVAVVIPEEVSAEVFPAVAAAVADKLTKGVCYVHRKSQSASGKISSGR